MKNEESMKAILYRFAFASAEQYFSSQKVDSLRLRIVTVKPLPLSDGLKKKSILRKNVLIKNLSGESLRLFF
ncbi:hypothetical protein AAHB63_14445 [Bacillus thuringiensis]